MRRISEQIVDAMLEGRVKDWLHDKWNDAKVATGIGHDMFGLGKAEKGWTPKYGPIRGKTPVANRPGKAKYRGATGGRTWDITP